MTNFIHTGREKDIELHLIENISAISENCKWGEITKFQKQLQLQIRGKKPICDLMVWHKNGTGTVIEVKKFKGDLWQSHAIGQVLMYGEVLRANLGEYPRMVICSDYISPLVKLIIKSQNLPIKTLEIDGDKVTYI